MRLGGFEQHRHRLHPAGGVDVGPAELGSDLGVSPVELVGGSQGIQPGAPEPEFPSGEAEIEPDPGVTASKPRGFVERLGGILELCRARSR